jgi:hypothetical protein
MISEDFEEAAAILNKFPRGAAALTRVCIQHMMPLLKENAKNLDENISSLVRKGLEVEIQQAMDVLQVGIGRLCPFEYLVNVERGPPYVSQRFSLRAA